MSVEKGRLKVQCPHCKKILTGHLSTEGKLDNPSKGDICICIDCHSILKYQGGAKLKKISIAQVRDKKLRDTLQMALYMVMNQKLLKKEMKQ